MVHNESLNWKNENHVSFAVHAVITALEAERHLEVWGEILSPHELQGHMGKEGKGADS